MSDVDFGVLGPLRVVVGGTERPIGPCKHRVLLAALLVRANRQAHPDELVDALWPDRPPAGARRTLQTYIRRLRGELGAAGALVRVHQDGYSMRVDPGGLDLSRFTGLVERAALARGTGDLDTARSCVDQALAQWRGTPLAGVPGVAAWPEVARLTELRCLAAEQRAELDIARGEPASAIADLRSAVAEHPLHERFHALLIRALADAGRGAEAMVAYHDAAGLLDAQLGVRPGAELRGLHAELLGYRSSR